MYARASNVISGSNACKKVSIRFTVEVVEGERFGRIESSTYALCIA